MRQGPLDPGSTLDWAEAERMQEQRTATIEEAEDLRDQLVTKVRSKRANSYEIAELLARAKRSNAHEPLTCASFGQLAVRFGAATSETSARQLVKTWELLQELPPLLDVARKGEASWSNLREAARAATPANAADWVDSVLSESYDEVRARAQRALDEEPTKRWSAELLLTTHARLRRWIQAQNERLGRSLTGDDAIDLLLATAERASGAPGGDGEGPSLPAPAARLVFYSNAEHTRAEVEGPSGPIELAREELEELECDAEHQHGDGKVTASIPAKIRRVVFARDRGRCAVPGCGALGFLHEHHVGEGGRRKTGHDPEKLTLLCSGHHRLVHRGWLRIEGTYTTGFRFLDARGIELPGKRRESILVPPGAPAQAPRPRGRSPDLDESIARGFGRLGLKITEARALVAHARRELPHDVDADTLTAAALRCLPAPGRR